MIIVPLAGRIVEKQSNIAYYPDLSEYMLDLIVCVNETTVLYRRSFLACIASLNRYIRFADSDRRIEYRFEDN